jgi:DNA-binding NarL/FixJ family response regulator
VLDVIRNRVLLAGCAVVTLLTVEVGAHRRGRWSDAGLEALSPREREIAELVADRRTNREIAEALFLSEKTVESHLRNVFRKLSASSRVQVARAIEKERAEPS